VVLCLVKLDCGHEGYYNVWCHPFRGALLACEVCQADRHSAEVLGDYYTDRETLLEARARCGH